MNPNIRRYIAEFIGTFTLVFVGTAVATIQGISGIQGVLGGGHGGAQWLEIAFAFGLTLMVLVLVIGPVSGCHVNPAVTIPMALAGRLKMQLVPGYLIAQLSGGLVAAGLLRLLLGGMEAYYPTIHGVAANGNPHDISIGSLLSFEIVLTALFLLTIFSATRSDSPAGFAALAIGGYLFVAHLVGAQLGDASLNPARSIGPAIIQGGDALGILWLFIVGPLIGGVLGLGLYKVIYKD
ncbi:MAG: aquaporin [Planctomycetes bacterium]|nr:aquaporin [Planctomycetota bacterium]